MPCAGFLRRGERGRFAVDDLLRKMVKNGCVTVVEGSLDGPAAEASSTFAEPAHFDLDDDPVTVVPFVPVEDADDDPPAPDADGDKPPAKNASRKAWATFLRARGVAFPDGDESKGEAWAGRDDLIVIWQQQHGG